jgi:hypothetical protein
MTFRDVSLYKEFKWAERHRGIERHLLIDFDN